jgi:plasmid maintenance system antidote protein VapI
MSTKEQKIIEDAAKLIGPAELAKELGVSEQEVAQWIDGSADVTGSTFKKLSALLVRLANRNG